MKLGIVTCAALPQLARGDQPLPALLAARGLAAEAQVWNDPAVDWSRFPSLLIRTPWDYTEHAGAFLDWLSQREAAGCHLLNPAPMLRWNLDKRYLARLEQQGVNTVPTLFLNNADEARALAATALGWKTTNHVVLKPVVSASARGTWVADWPLGDDDLSRLAEQCVREVMMLQPFVDEIETEGEWSVMVFAGQYSHAVLKTPEAGDFRVQSEHGGRSQALDAEPALVAASLAAVRTAEHITGQPCCYARVDWVRYQGRWALMELELIEPELFLDTSPGAAARFADAVRASLE